MWWLKLLIKSNYYDVFQIFNEIKYTFSIGVENLFKKIGYSKPAIFRGLIQTFNSLWRIFISEGKKVSFGKLSLPHFWWRIWIVSTLKFPVMTCFWNKYSFLFLIPYFLSLDSFLIFSYKHFFSFDSRNKKAEFSVRVEKVEKYFCKWFRKSKISYILL